MKLPRVIPKEWFVLFLILLVNGILFLVFYQDNVFPGHDSPYYLHNTQLLISGKGVKSILDKDRLLTFLVPALITTVFRLTIIQGMGVFAFLLQSFFLISLFLLGKQVAKNLGGLIAVMLALTSFAYFRISWDLFANLFGLVIINFALVSFLAYLRTGKKAFFIQAAVLNGLLFYIHNLCAFLYSAIFLGSFLLATFLNARADGRLRKRSVILLLGIYLLIIAFFAFPYLYSFLFLKEQGDTPDQYYRVAGSSNIRRFLLVAQGLRNSQHVQEVKDEIVGRSRDFLGDPIIIASFLGTLLFFIRNRHNRELQLLAFMSIGYILAIFQYNFGLIYIPVYPDRYIFFYFPLACVWSAFSFSEIYRAIAEYNNLAGIKVLLSFGLLIFFTPRFVEVFNRNSNMVDYVSRDVMTAMESVSGLFLKESSRVIFIEGYKFWFQVYNPEYAFVFGGSRSTCGDKSNVSSYSPIIENTSLLLSSDPTEIAQILKKRKKLFLNGFKTEYILVNTQPKDEYEKCVNLEMLANSPYFELIYKNGTAGIYQVHYDEYE